MDSIQEGTQKKSFYKTVPGATIISAFVIGGFALISTVLTYWSSQQNEVIADHDLNQIPQGTIASPISNEKVVSPIKVEGTLQNIPEECHIWISVQVGNLQWPKEKIDNHDQKWLKFIIESGEAGKDIGIVLLKVDPDGNKTIQNWFQKGDNTGTYPGFERIPGSEILDIVSVSLE